MAGTDSTRPALAGGPAIVLVEPQLGENIGTAARAMLNCGLTDMRLIRPRESFPNRYAIAAAAGADEVLEAARRFDETARAVDDLQHVFATTARTRDMVKPVVTPREAARLMREAEARGERCGILFGRERTGLVNDDLMLASTIIMAPLNPAYSSLNLAQAVLLIGYEWLLAADATPATQLPLGSSRPATGEEVDGFFGQLETELDDSGFFPTAAMKPTMWRNIRNVFLRAGLTEQEVRTLRGMVSRLVGKRHRRRPDDPAPGEGR